MNTTFLTQLKSHLPEQTWPWVIAALRHDELVWKTLLENDSILQAPNGARHLPENWSPAWVAFITLGQPVPAPNATLSLGLRQRAFQTYEAITHRRQTANEEMQPITRAALLALALRERLRLTGKWDNLIEELALVPSDIWRTPLACLYGLIEKPLDLLHALLIPGGSSEIYNLAIHSLLSNPLPPEILSAQLQLLMENLPISEIQKLLLQLVIIRPKLAAELARSVNITTEFKKSDIPLSNLSYNFHRAKIALIAGNRSAANSNIHIAQDNARLVLASLAAQNAQISDTPLTSWQKAFEYAPEQPLYRSRLALAYIEANNMTDAGVILDPSENTGHPELLYASALLAHLSGDDDRAKQLATQALSILETQFDTLQNPQETIPSLTMQLARLLLDLNLPSASIRTARFAIHERTDDPERLILMGQAQFAASQPMQAAEAYQWAVLLAPQCTDMHRRLAECLEAAGEWEMALNERKIMSATPPSRIDDQYALANCALHLNQSEYASEICRSILLKDPTDGMAHTLLGESFAALGDLNSAQEQFTQASELAPNLPRPWLALASAYNQDKQPQKALETLLFAVQAIPGSGDIHLALGEQYLATNSTTQALSAFQRAAEIEPRSVPIALRYGHTLYQLGHLPQAHQILEQAYQQDPTNTEVAHIFARTLLGQGDPRTALTPLETVVASTPIDPEPFVDYGRALLLTQGEATKATQALRHALELRPDHAEAQALLGESLAAEKDYPASLQAYQTALETPLAQNPEWRSRLSYGLGSVALRLGKIEIAIATLLEAVQLDPQNYRPHCLLSDAYQTLKLIPDAHQSAREALRLAGDDLPVMIWYVEKTLELADNEPTTGNGTVQANLHNEELRHHALQILARAAEIASAEVDMLLRIANIQSNAGDPASAANNLRRIANIKTAIPIELQQAAQILINLKDAKGAVLCYEKALENEAEKADNQEFRISLLTQLAHAYRLANNSQAAFQTIEKAILLSPGDARLCLEKTCLFIEMGQSQSALDFVEEELNHIPNPGLHHIAAFILQTQGKPLEALSHAEAGAEGAFSEDEIGHESGQQFSIVLAAELARALLQPDQARQILQNQAMKIKAQNCSTCSLFNVLWAEISLDEGNEIDAANFLGIAVIDPGSRSPRSLALQARLMARRGDHHTAMDIYQTALQFLEKYELGNNGSINILDEKASPYITPRSNPLALQSMLYPLTEAALELNLWGIALRLAQKAVQIAPFEPLAHFNMVRVLVQRAEFQHLCNDTDLIHHAPGPIALSEGTRHTFSQTIQDILSICENLSQRSQLPAVPSSVTHWLIRGNAVFSPSEQTARALETLARDSIMPEDIAASYAALRRIESQNEPQEVTNDLHSGLILTQIALSIAERQPQEAIKALQLAILSEPVRDTSHAIRQYLLARLACYQNQSVASTAIKTAITILPDEPRWRALAARIDIANGDKSSAINHLEQAIQLEPRHIEHHLTLGNLYLHYAEEGNASDAQQAVKCLERATRMSPDHPETWLTLARAHRLAGNLEQAAAAAERTAALAPEIIASHLIQAEIALQSGKLQVAYDHAQTAVRLQPDSQEAALILSCTLQALERPAEALAVIDKAIPVAEQTLEQKLKRIQLLRQSKGPETALQAANELADVHPDEPAVLAILSETQAEAGQEEGAIRTAQKAVLLGDNLPTAQQAGLRLLLGQLLRRAGQLDQAVHYLNDVIRLEPENIEAYLELGRSHQDRRQQAQALLMYRQAANIAPHDPRPYLQAGLALKEGKDYIESESMLRRAADLDPNDTTIRRQLAAVIAINLVHNPRRPIQTETL